MTSWHSSVLTLLKISQQPEILSKSLVSLPVWNSGVFTVFLCVILLEIIYVYAYAYMWYASYFLRITYIIYIILFVQNQRDINLRQRKRSSPKTIFWIAKNCLEEVLWRHEKFNSGDRSSCQCFIHSTTCYIKFFSTMYYNHYTRCTFWLVIAAYTKYPSFNCLKQFYYSLGFCVLAVLVLDSERWTGFQGWQHLWAEVKVAGKSSLLGWNCQ